ncbi:hypothetical protein PR048_015463 [Dryococelus australis]|uniref:Uncharacterized protein n=1 Tax=Dryococelus australis TaxID=614101 RepID=A0ABQ9HH19_9NEOP|nr:hypothetical protein PR048_015463 [Dryococelus australis]
MEQRRNECSGGTRDPRENPPTSDIVRHDSHMRKSGSDPAGDLARFALSVGGKHDSTLRDRREAMTMRTAGALSGGSYYDGIGEGVGEFRALTAQLAPGLLPNTPPFLQAAYTTPGSASASPPVDNRRAHSSETVHTRRQARHGHTVLYTGPARIHWSKGRESVGGSLLLSAVTRRRRVRRRTLGKMTDDDGRLRDDGGRGVGIGGVSGREGVKPGERRLFVRPTTRETLAYQRRGVECRGVGKQLEGGRQPLVCISHQIGAARRSCLRARCTTPPLGALGTVFELGWLNGRLAGFRASGVVSCEEGKAKTASVNVLKDVAEAWTIVSSA